jgi:TolB-like protein
MQTHRAFAEDQDQEPIVNVLPFEVSEEGDYAYLNRAIDQMLLARLSRYQDIKIVTAALGDEETKALQQELQAGNLDAVAKRLRGQWLVEPSMYSLKEGMQINLSLIPLQGGRAFSFAEKIDSQDQIMTAVSSLAEDVYKTVVELESEDDSTPAPEEEDDALAGFATPHPERDYKKGLYGGASIVTGDQRGASFESRGIRKSGKLPVQVESLVVGDLDQDGTNELVISSKSKIRIFTYADLNFREIAEYNFSPSMKIHAINIGDHDNSGTPKLYISANEGRFASSAILSWNGGESLQSVSQALRWYIRPVTVPGKGEVLIGQQASLRSIENYLSPGVFELTRDPETGRMVRGAKMLLPEGTNLFDFIQADLNGDGATETVVIDDKMRMLVYDAALNLIWVSNANYGGSKRYFGPEWQRTGKDELSGMSLQQQDNRTLVFMPGRLDVKDITGDGLPEVVISTNEINVATKYFTNVRSFDGGSVACLGWYGQGLVELWQTSRIDGYVADYFFDKDAEQPENNTKVINRLYVAQIPVAPLWGRLLSGAESKLLAYEMVVKKVEEKQENP